MRFLVTCDHIRQIVEQNSYAVAIAQHPCKRCKVFDLEREKWVYKDIRIYAAVPEDERILAQTHVPIDKSRKPLLDQTDWVKASGWHDTE